MFVIVSVGFVSALVRKHLRKCETFYLMTASPERVEDNLPGAWMEVWFFLFR